MTKVVSQITGSAAPPPIRLTEMNWAEPAKTRTDMAIAANGGNPAATASVPKMMANGVVPMTSGRMSRAPASATSRLLRMAAARKLAQVDTGCYIPAQKRNHKRQRFSDDGCSMMTVFVVFAVWCLKPHTNPCNREHRTFDPVHATGDLS